MTAARKARPHVVLYTRDGCGLCATAAQLVAREARRAIVEVIDVDSDAGMADAYGVRVPVVTVDGAEIAAYELAPGVIRAALRAARRQAALGRRRPQA